MTTARLLVDPSSIALRAPPWPATGDIVLELGSVVFPATGWNDFVIVILEAWISALVRLVQNTSTRELVHFMDGPYEVDVRRVESGALQLRAMERPAKLHALIEVTPLPLLEDAAKSAEAVLQVCREASYRSRDVDRLESALAALRMETQRHGARSN